MGNVEKGMSIKVRIVYTGTHTVEKYGICTDINKEQGRTRP